MAMLDHNMRHQRYAFPARLLQYIFKFLIPVNGHLKENIHDNQWEKDLLSCSFVCKSWRKLALRYLFYDYTLHFEGYDSIQDFQSLLLPDGTSPLPGGRTLQQFGSFIRGSPAIGSLICNLSLVLTNRTQRFNSLLDPTALRFLLVLRSLPALCTLELCDVCLNTTLGTSQELFQQLGNINLERLLIGYTDSGRYARPSQIMHLLCCFGDVLELCFDTFEVDTTTPDRIPPDPPNLHVSTLVIANVNLVRALLGPLNPEAFTRSLKSLCVAGLAVYGTLSLNRFLSRLGERSELWKLRMNMDSLRSDFWRPTPLSVDLAPCRKLRTLIFRMTLREGCYVRFNARNRALFLCMAKALDTLVVAPPVVQFELHVGVRLPQALAPTPQDMYTFRRSVRRTRRGDVSPDDYQEADENAGTSPRRHGRDSVGPETKLEEKQRGCAESDRGERELRRWLSNVAALTVLSSALVTLIDRGLQGVHITLYGTRSDLDDAEEDEALIELAMRDLLADPRVAVRFRCVESEV